MADKVNTAIAGDKDQAHIEALECVAEVARMEAEFTTVPLATDIYKYIYSIRYHDALRGDPIDWKRIIDYKQYREGYCKESRTYKEPRGHPND